MTTAPRFAHASEAELARILDYYQVAWEYEPRVFPILWNLDGAVVESFAPDFYLPELDLYVELTTLKQSLVRKKNRKLRRLRELYPDLRIKLFYGKDFKALLLKYGRIEVAASLTGLGGQAAMVRAAPDTIPALGGPAGVSLREEVASAATPLGASVDAAVPADQARGVVRLSSRSRARRERRRRVRGRTAVVQPTLD